MAVKDLEWSASAHEVGVVASAGVVAVQPALELGVELGDGLEALAVERGPVELLQGRTLEAFAHGVVVGRAGRDAVMDDFQAGHVAGEILAATEFPGPYPSLPVRRPTASPDSFLDSPPLFKRTGSDGPAFLR